MARYILDANNNPVATDNIWEWARQHDDIELRRVAKTVVSETIEVSTVFLGLDHRFDDEGPPVLFETLIRGGPHDDYMERYCTWEEAVAGHKRAVEMAEGKDEA